LFCLENIKHKYVLDVITMLNSGIQERWQNRALFASDNQLDTGPRRFGQLRLSDPQEPLAVLRSRFSKDGYLYLKGLLDPKLVNAFRGWVFENLNVSGLLQPETDSVLGIANRQGFDKAFADRRLMSIVRSAKYENFCSQPDLANFIDCFIGGMSYLHKRKLIRFTAPNTTVATPAHYDLVYLRGGTSNIVTAWIPIGDISVAEGGLVYLKNSHALGVQMEKESKAWT
jgi:ectoine hydroxylase-related dioxygenase (phytanoyl-CoA dioxygenase family)